MNVGGDLGLPRPANEVFTFDARRDALCFVAKAFRVFVKTLIQRGDLSEATSLSHVRCSIPEEGGSATGVLITDVSQDPGGDVDQRPRLCRVPDVRPI
jgi:hypothetical protein